MHQHPHGDRRGRASSAALLLGAILVVLTLLVGGDTVQPSAERDHSSADGPWVWQWQDPRPTGNGLVEGSFVDPNNGWVVGSNGTVLPTTDGGQTWIEQDPGLTNDLRHVQFVDPIHGWATTYGATYLTPHGPLLATSDGGNSWQAQAVNAADLTFVNSAMGWAAGSSPEGSGVFFTADGGRTWSLQNTGTFTNALSVSAIDSNNVWATSADGSVLRSSDGGRNWVARSPSSQGSFWRLIRFADASHGWIAGAYCGDGAGTVDCFPMMRTTDGGTTWLPLSAGRVSQIVNMRFLDANNGWAVGDDLLLRTTDGGLTWSSTAGWARDPFRPLGLAFANVATGWALGYNGQIFHTTDGGNTWTQQSSILPANATEITFLDSQTGWAAGRMRFSGNGAILRTTDGGASWSIFETPNAVSSVQFIDRLTGWAVTPERIFKSVDGGVTWAEVYRSQDVLLLNMSFVDPQNGWVAGRGNTPALLRTTDGGLTWIKQYPGLGGSSGMLRAKFVDPSNGWIVESRLTGGRVWDPQYSGTILRTTDGGNTWSVQKADLPVGLSGLTFLDVNTGWAVGAHSTILHTTDGGNTWIAQRTAAHADFQSVSFADPQHGWAVGHYGVIVRTTDGGATWIQERVRPRYPLTAVSAIDAERAWVVGPFQTMLSRGQRASAAPPPLPTPVPPTPTPRNPCVDVTPTPLPAQLPTPSAAPASVTNRLYFPMVPGRVCSP